jgi:hypothetical protein
MLTSTLFGFVAKRNRSRGKDFDTVASPIEEFGAESIAADFLLLSLLVLTASALIWLLAPAVLSALTFCSPTVAAFFNLSLPADCSAIAAGWYVVKRVLVGYAGLSFASTLIALGWHLVLRRRRVIDRRTYRRWAVVIEDCDKE